MALIWADNFAMYGADPAALTNGVYAGVYSTLLVIPDNNPDKAYAYLGGLGNIGDSNIRYVLPSERDAVGQAAFFYFEELPWDSAIRPAIMSVRSSGNVPLYSLSVLPDGRLAILQGDATGTPLYFTPSPVITANADVHVEWKVVIDPVEGSFEVRVRGKTVLLVEDIDTGSTLIGQVAPHNKASFGGFAVVFHMKHFIIWDTLGAVNNDFLGQVMVYWNPTISTISEGGWSSSAGASVDETLNKPLWANQLTSSGSIVNSDTVRIQDIYYRWTSSAPTTGAGTSANPWLVALGADSAESLKNMYEAINASGVPGTTYSPGLVEHPLVKGFGLIADAFCVVPKVEGTTTMTFSETGAALSWTSTTTFLYRVWDPIRMSAGYTPAVKATGFLTFSGNPSDGDSVAVGGTTFTFKISPSAATDVAIGGTSEITAVNLASNISGNLSTVVAEASALLVDLTAVSAGALGNTISLASTSAVITTSDSTLEGGEDITYPDPFEVGLTPLPDDVTSIRAVIPVVRAAKLDGGDGNIQVSFGTLNTNYDVGPDTPITNAFTYWGNATEPFVSEINPDTGTPWTPGEFNLGARIRVARTK